MIAKFSNSFINWLISISHLEIDFDQKEVYVYGLECFLNTSITFFLLFFWGIISHNLIGTTIWVISFCTLRKHTGGYHAHTQYGCITSSTLLGISSSFLFFIPGINHCVTQATILAAAFLYFAITAPVISASKFLTKNERYKNKLAALIILSINITIMNLIPPRLALFLLHSILSTALLSILALLTNMKVRNKNRSF